MSEFKPISSIPGYEEFTKYDADVNGSLRRDGKIHQWSLDRDGYLQTVVSVNGCHKLIRQHRMIALLFIPNPENKPCVDHRNRNPTDNRVENLRWATIAENSRNQTYSSYDHHIYKICKRCVCWYWMVRIKLYGKQVTKSFRCDQDDTEPPAEVIAHRDQMIREHHGEFASI